MVCQFNAWDRVIAAYRLKDVCVLNKVSASVRIRSIQDEVVSVIRVGDVTSCCRLFRIKSLLGVRLRWIPDEVVSVIRVGDVTSCSRLFRKTISKRRGEELWWKSPKTINL